MESHLPIFMEMLNKEIALYSNYQYHDWAFDTIFFGGGSPGLTHPKHLYKVINNINKKFNTINNLEITIEINPDELSKNDLLKLKQAGINRLSIGFQSLHQILLETISRTHNAQDCIESYNNAREVGFDNINIDMMYNIPNQSLDHFLKDLNKIINIEPNHVTLYPLTINNNTHIYNQIKKGEISQNNEEEELIMYKNASQLLKANEFIHYEVAHFSKINRECKHNKHYWNLDRYLAFGPSSHGYDGSKRWWNVDSLENYIKMISNNNKPIDDFEILNKYQKYNEQVIWGLRTLKGINIELLKEFLDDFELQKNINKWKKELFIENETIFINPDFYFLSDLIINEFIITNY